MILPLQLKEAYRKGENISNFLKTRLSLEKSNEFVIELSYDLQAGSYTKAMKNPLYRKEKERFSRYVGELISSLGRSSTVLEAGVGEATTLSGVISSIGPGKRDYYGFDLSWSRTAYARKYLGRKRMENCSLFSASLMNIPLASNSMDVVYTAHSIEPNRGNEMKIIEELYRVAGKYLILIEPAYESAPPKIRKRFDFHSYCRGIVQTCRKLKYNIVSNELLPVKVTQDNLTEVTIIEKNPRSARKPFAGNPFCCPKYGTPLRKTGASMYSDDSMIAYPIIGGIPCLKIQNGVIASKLSEFE